MVTALVLAQEKTDEPAPTEGNGGKSGFDPGILIPFVLILVLMYFIMLRPQRKQEKKRRQMLSQMEKNERVITIGGIQGVIYSMDENDVVLKIDERNDIRITVAKSAIARVIREEDKTEYQKPVS